MLTMLVYVTFALALVLILRRPTRQLFGATPAFTLWLLPPLLPGLPFDQMLVVRLGDAWRDARGQPGAKSQWYPLFTSRSTPDLTSS